MSLLKIIVTRQSINEEMLSTLMNQRLSYSVKIDPMYGVFQSNSFHLDVCKNNMVPEKDYGSRDWELERFIR